MPFTPCRAPMCAGLVNPRDKKMRGYCDKHAHKRNNWHTKRTDTRQRMNGYKWQQRRAERMALDGYTCVLCEQLYNRLTPAEEVDHIKPVFLGGTDDLDNLRALCRPCHVKVTTEQQKEGRRLAAERAKKHYNY